jgi:hypothetical protein
MKKGGESEFYGIGNPSYRDDGRGDKRPIRDNERILLLKFE